MTNFCSHEGHPTKIPRLLPYFRSCFEMIQRVQTENCCFFSTGPNRETFQTVTKVLCEALAMDCMTTLLQNKLAKMGCYVFEVFAKARNRNTPQKETPSTPTIDSLRVTKITNISILQIIYILHFICKTVSNIYVNHFALFLCLA